MWAGMVIPTCKPRATPLHPCVRQILLQKITPKFQILHQSPSNDITMGGAQALKRIPRIKFPQRHPKLAGFESQTEAVPLAGDSSHAFFSGSKATTTNTLGGKASDQPQRTPVSKEEIEAILLGGCI